MPSLPKPQENELPKIGATV